VLTVTLTLAALAVTGTCVELVIRRARHRDPIEERRRGIRALDKIADGADHPHVAYPGGTHLTITASRPSRVGGGAGGAAGLGERTPWRRHERSFVRDVPPVPRAVGHREHDLAGEPERPPS
jgi:hypothetical protein